MNMHSIKALRKPLAAALLLGGLVLAGEALADPASFLPSASPIVFKYNNNETLITGAGQTLTGIFSITQITNPLGSTTYWATGSPAFDNTLLTGVFTGLISNAPTGTSPNVNITFTGGTLDVYNVPVGSYVPTSPGDPIDSQICGGACPAPWLTFNFTPGIVPSEPTTTLSSTVTSATAPLTGSGFGELTLTGGTAAAHFNKLFSLNSNISSCPGPAGTGYAVLCGSAGSWPVVSFDPVTGTTVPEPGTLFLMGAGLLGIPLVRRRRARAA
ncbi:MAG: PEP-CTERM sorting domain-containing protein [Betaproteobacteria bacterium]|nr:PEP-CTERM sorting domain-containing protein [Betaproteobacteria bacterium]